MTTVRRIATAVVIALVAGACTGSGSTGTTTSTTAATTAAPTTTATSVDAPTVDRLVVIDDGQQVVTMDRDGGNPAIVSEEGDVPFQPVWSPDGTRIAYSARSTAPEFVVAAADGTERVSAPSVVPAFYFFWSPDGRRLGALRNGAQGLAFEIVEVAADGVEINQVDTGQPFYFSWSPEGDLAIAHVGADRLDLIDGTGSAEPLGSEPGLFQAPQWTDGGIFAVVRRGGSQELVAIDDAGDLAGVVSADGPIIFSASPDGSLVAAQTFGTADDESGVSAGLLQTPDLPAGTLSIIDVAKGDISSVTEGPAVAFFWSPVLDRLLVLGADPDQAVLRWSVWDDGQVLDGPEFRPSPRWLTEFLPFYDQYNQSVALWAPDASAYAFPGFVGDDEGVFVTPYDAADAELISDGNWVAWSPN